MSESRNSYTYKILIESLENKNITLLTKDFKDKTFIKRETTIKISCNNCKRENECSILNLMLRGCKFCNKGNSNYDLVQESLEKENYQLLTSYEEFCAKENKNGTTKSKFFYICSQGHNGSCILQNWKKNVRCLGCKNQKQTKYNISNTNIVNNNINNTNDKLLDIKEIFKKKGFELIDENYKSNKIPLKCICSCGEIAYIALNNMQKEERIGCKKCYGLKKKYLWENRIKFFEEQDCKIICDEKEFTETKNIRYICKCGNKDTKTWKLFKMGHRCKECGEKSRQETNMKKYGTKYYFQSDDFKQKSIETNMKIRGVPHNMMYPPCVEKAYNTNIEDMVSII